MGGFRIYTGNRLEILADRLAENMRNSQKAVFAPHTVIVQSRGMDRWLNLRLAEKFGISANIFFPFPRSFISDTVFSRIFGNVPTGIFSPSIMALRIMNALPGLLENPEFEAVAGYIGKDEGGPGENPSPEKVLRIYQLSREIARAFDQYMIYRPMMMSDEKWEWVKPDGSIFTHPEKDWQMKVWQNAYSGEERSGSPAVLYRKFMAGPGKKALLSSVGSGAIPGDIHVFGINMLPRYYLDVFKVLSESIDISFYYFSPCREYWEDIRREKEILRKTIGRDPDESMHYEVGNPLLASMGDYGREFFGELVNISESISLDEDNYVENDDGSLLASLQNAVLNLRAGPDFAPGTGRINIRINNCYSPMREVEVLHDHVLKIIQEAASADKAAIDPKDILVMVPDLDSYAPYVQAVFDSPEKDADGFPRKKIPYSIADKSLGSENKVLSCFMQILGISKRRYAVSSILEILETPELRANFSIREEEFESIKAWIRESGIRWGRDETSRKGLGDFVENSWKFGLDRMILGFCLGTEGNMRIYDGIFPYDKIEDSAALSLGKLAEFADRIFRTGEDIYPRRLGEWRTFLSKVLDDFFGAGSDSSNELIELRKSIGELSALESDSGLSMKLPFEVIEDHLKESLGEKTFEGRFIQCGVTFCKMLPMRSIPFKVVCILGMNDGIFPRREKKRGFDLISADVRQPCDRNQRLDDRYLFLEALLSARSYFYVSYTGLSSKDNKPIPPSPLVDELKDYIFDSIRHESPAAAEDFRNSVYVEHPLQAFSRKYFEVDRDGRKKYADLFSFSHGNYLGAKNLAGTAVTKPGFFDCPPLEAPDNEARTVSIDRLCSFFVKCSETLVNSRLNINIRLYESESIEDEEPLEIGGLEEYKLRQILLDSHIGKQGLPEVQEKETPPICQIFKGMGVLPPEPKAGKIVSCIEADVDAFAKKVAEKINGRHEAPLAFSFKNMTFLCELHGIFRNIYRGGDGVLRQIFYRPSSAKPKDYLRSWIYHLAANAFFERIETLMISMEKDKTGTLSFKPLVEKSPLEMLDGLAGLYLEGLVRPLPFFPESSKAFFDTWTGTRTDSVEELERKAVLAALSRWNGNSFTGARGEGEDRYVALCFPDSFLEKYQDSATYEEFKKLSLDIFGTIRDNL